MTSPPKRCELLDQGVEHPVQVLRQLFGAAVRAELGGERLGQRGEAGDVREKCRTVNAVGHDLAARERPPAVAGNVSLKLLLQVADCDCPGTVRHEAAAVSASAG